MDSIKTLKNMRKSLHPVDDVKTLKTARGLHHYSSHDPINNPGAIGHQLKMMEYRKNNIIPPKYVNPPQTNIPYKIPQALDLLVLTNDIYEEDIAPGMKDYLCHWKQCGVQTETPGDMRKFVRDNMNIIFSANAFAQELKRGKIDINSPVYKAWIKFAQNPPRNTGFRGRLYVSDWFNCSVIVFRGTDNTINYIEDGLFALNYDTRVYADALNFYDFVIHHPIVKKYPLKAVCGHSLGGILAKSIAPVTGITTYAFNSPGVLDYLKNVVKKPTLLKHGQRVRTYISNADPIGNLKWKCDLGDHIFIPVFGAKYLNDLWLQYPTYWALLDFVALFTMVNPIEGKFSGIGTKYHHDTDLFTEMLKRGLGYETIF